MAVWTKEALLDKLATSDIMVERSLLIMYSRQTMDEQLTKNTSNENGVGFTVTDATILSSFAQRVIGEQISNIPEGRRMSNKMRAITRYRLAKYSRQLLEVANKA